MADIIYLNPHDIIPYQNNARKNDGAVQSVVNSIKEFGFRNPIILDKDNVVICGHTRLKAALKLKLKTVPCIIADDLTEEQVKAYRLADNKTGEIADWDYNLLEIEMEEICNINMEDFGFEIYNENEVEKDYAHETQQKVENILNLGKAQFDGVGKYDIPEIEPVYELPEIKEWIGFNYVLSDDNPEGKAVHFFIDDYQFERVWNNPDKYVDKLRQYVCITSPDFSPYGDMPLATQIFNHYRKHWVARYFQECGITVIPTIRASADERSLEFFLEGEPEESIVICSSMWTSASEENYKSSKQKWEKMIETLNPSKVFVYGKITDFMGGVNIERVPTFGEKWER